ncbi:hypothetical protein K450DRAFT_244783 [Umbelopsis ramanniana AG]|uniref:DNA replication complex GINS protein SLD5 n=1 Tax=Umbelopsis ramanniana AG TaxID=1314678 RepID=A0AAD5E9K3_UMBRA|nr:uncharacterized protein K450DRAFT_244783 [Umbelopsis ramanniana AG]KAI8578840.1 hypothetical protein K450DRAFT_244783 [Umbelopsis ramanniana AG]
MDNNSTLNSSIHITQSSEALYETGLDDEFATDDVAEMTQIWINERNSPEILPYRRRLVEDLTELIEHQGMVAMEGLSENVDMRFRSMLYQTEMERIKFLIRNYLRTRLYKIEKYTTYLLNRPDVRERLSDKEYEYAQSYAELLEKHYSKSFLNTLPQSQQDVNEKINTLSSVSVPDEYSAVIVRGKEEQGMFELESRRQYEIRLSPESIYMVRYSDIKLLLEEGQVELI